MIGPDGWERKRELMELYDQSRLVYDARYRRTQFQKFGLTLGGAGRVPPLTLDIGCGTGLLLEYLTASPAGGTRETAAGPAARERNCDLWGDRAITGKTAGVDCRRRAGNAGQVGTYVGVDFSRGVLSAARVKEAPGIKVHLVQADCSHLPLREVPFWAVVSYSTLMNVPDRERCLDELRRVTSIGNHLVCVTVLKKKVTLDEFKGLLREFFPEELGGEHLAPTDCEDYLFVLSRH
ncbi:MAG: class I SAM-dependent methyltransferase [Promethearchaeota archaeon]